jgi:hypothetical protein
MICTMRPILVAGRVAVDMALKGLVGYEARGQEDDINPKSEYRNPKQIQSTKKE